MTQLGVKEQRPDLLKKKPPTPGKRGTRSSSNPTVRQIADLNDILKDASRSTDCRAKTPYVLSYCDTSDRRMNLLGLVATEFLVSIKVMKKVPAEYQGIYAVAFLNYAQIWVFEEHVESDDRFISCLYHEIGHVLCRRAKRYYAFHKGTLSKTQFNKVALRAERYVDKVARQLVARRHPSVKYLSDYDKHSPDSRPVSNVYMDDHGGEEDREYIYEQLDIDPTVRKPRGMKKLLYTV